MKSGMNPMQSAHASPRCTARSKRSSFLCKNPAVRGWRVCRMHGAGGGHAPGPEHPAWKHGMRSEERTDERRMLNEFVREAREFERMISDGLAKMKRW